VLAEGGDGAEARQSQRLVEPFAGQVRGRESIGDPVYIRGGVIQGPVLVL